MANKRGNAGQPLPLSDRDDDHMQGHWLLARLGKRVLRPGGVELTRTLLARAEVTDADVLELAPGLGRVAAKRGPGGAARMERRRCVGVARNRLAGNSVDGRAGAGRAVGGLAGAVSQRSHNPRGGARSAGPPARPTLRGSPAGRGRQPGPRRLRRNAGGVGRRNRCSAGADAGHRGTRVADLGSAANDKHRTLGVTEHRMSGWPDQPR